MNEPKFETMGEPMEAQYVEPMQILAKALDRYFNGETRGQDRKVGFCLLVFPFHDHDGRCNYISNGASRRDMIAFFREMAARFEGSPEQFGRG